MNMFAPSSAKNIQQQLEQCAPSQKEDFARLYDLIGKWAKTSDIKLFGKIIGYGSYKYHYPSGRSGTWMQVGLACGKTYFSVYICEPENGQYLAEKYGSQLGAKVSVGRSCIRFKRLSDINLEVLEKLVKMVKFS